MGASALVVDQARMKEYLRLSILRNMVHPLVEMGLTPSSQQSLAQTITSKIVDLQEKVQNRAKEITSLSPLGGFEKKYDDTHSQWVKGHTLSNMVNRLVAVLRHRPSLAPKPQEQMKTVTAVKEIFALKKELVAEFMPPSENLAALLAGYYMNLRESLVQNLGEAENREYGRLLQLIIGLLDVTFEPKDSSDEKRAELKSQLGRLREECPAGLPATIYAMECAIAALKNSPDLCLDNQPVPAHPMENDDYLTALAESDAAAIQGAYRRYFRFVHSLLSVPGLLLKLVPAWLLLTGIVRVIANWSEIKSALVAAISLAVVGGFEGIFWLVWQKERRFEEYQHQCEQRIANSVLRLIATVLRDYRLSSLRHLNDIQFALKKLQPLLTERYVEAQRQLTALKARYEIPDWDTTTIYRLSNLKDCDAWAVKALEQTGPSGSISNPAARTIAEQIIGRRQPAAYYHVFHDIERIAQEQAAQLFQSLGPEALAEGEEPVPGEKPLAGEKRWEWLYWKAHPLGKSESPAARPFTMVALASDAALTGAAGGYPREEGWLIIRSRQPHEIICLRGIVEPVAESAMESVTEEDIQRN